MPVKVGEVRQIKQKGLPAWNRDTGNCTLLVATKILIKKVTKTRFAIRIELLLPNGTVCQAGYDEVFANTTRL